MSRFKTRYHITGQTIHGESGGIDQNFIEINRKKIKEFTQNYSPDDIYNADETALFFRLPPNKTLAVSGSSVSGQKINKERLQI